MNDEEVGGYCYINPPGSKAKVALAIDEVALAVIVETKKTAALASGPATPAPPKVDTRKPWDLGDNSQLRFARGSLRPEEREDLKRRGAILADHPDALADPKHRQVIAILLAQPEMNFVEALKESNA